MITLPPLPFEKDGLAPYISAQTLSYHYDKHHRTYVDKLNGLIQDTPMAELPLEDIILQSSGAIFNNAAQVWNHSFYWQCLSSTHNQTPSDILNSALTIAFDTYENFVDVFTKESIGLFGSGWCWLVLDPNDFSLHIITTQNAGTPLTTGMVPLLTCDVWEHAYYLDTQNLRPKYLENFWACVNWANVSEQYQQATGTTA